MKNTWFCSILLALMFWGCENDLDVVAPGEELIVVYGLLNTADTVHYIKVNRGFASEKTAPIELAKDPDQLYFDSLQVSITNLSNGSVYPCEKASMAKDPGIFSQVNYLYKTTIHLQAGNTYEVKVFNPLNGQTAKSTLVLIGAPDLSVPGPNTINFYPFEPGKQFLVSFDGHIQAEIYEVRINFVYDEIDNVGGTTTRDTIRWNYVKGKFSDQKKLLLRNDGQVFYQYLADHLEQKGPDITRRGAFLEFEYWTGDKELYTYSEVYGTSTIGVVQKKTDYTNITGGHGLFAGRNFTKITGTSLDPRLVSQLKTNPVMTPFKFVD